MVGTRPGSSPEQAVYWFNGALVMLTAKLCEATALDEGILRIVRYREEKSPMASINAVLLSVEHVVLVKGVRRWRSGAYRRHVFLRNIEPSVNGRLRTLLRVVPPRTTRTRRRVPGVGETEI